MTELQLNEKVTATDSFKRHHVMVMKKGATGVIKEFKEIGEYQYTNSKGSRWVEVPHAVVELSNGKLVTVKLDYLKSYEKKVVEKIESYSNSKLVSEYGKLSAWEQQMAMGTKAHAKMMKDIARCEAELMKRLEA